jgi:hypothetical protein
MELSYTLSLCHSDLSGSRSVRPCRLLIPTALSQDNALAHPSPDTSPTTTDKTVVDQSVPSSHRDLLLPWCPLLCAAAILAPFLALLVPLSSQSSPLPVTASSLS